jgi:hypothetical protein
MKKCLFLLALATIGLAGCNPPAASTPTPKPEDPKTTTSPGSTPATEPVAKVEDIPANLKTDGFNYYGLGCTKTLSYKMTQQPNTGEKTGTQKVVYKGVRDGNPTFTIERDGELSILGNDEVIVKADGVYSTFAAATKIDPPMLNLPAKIEVGSTWPSQQTVKNTEGKEIKIDMSNKVVRKEKVKVAGGEFECFVTSTTGSMQTDDKITVNGTTWYAPGFGVVKLVINIKSKKGEQVDTIELTSQG